MDEISNTKEVLKRLAKNHDTAAVIAGRNKQRSIEDVKQYIASELDAEYKRGYWDGLDEGYNQCELDYMTKLQDQEEHMHTARVNVLRNCLEDIIKILDSSPSELARVLDELMQAEVKPL